MHVKTYFLKFKKYGILNYISKKSLTTEIKLSGSILKIYTLVTLAFNKPDVSKLSILHLAAAFLGAFAKLQKATIVSSCLSVSLSARMESAPTRRIFMKFDMSIS